MAVIEPIRRAFAVLEALNRRRSTTLSLLAAETGLPRPTLVRLLQTLIELGYASRMSREAGYRLTDRVLTLAGGVRFIDHLVDAVADFEPGPERRLGILVDHLVDGSKEWRLAASVRGPHVLVTGHPFVDVWAGIRPKCVGLTKWPDVPRGVPWKEGMARALGADLDGLWPKLRNRVKTYADLEPELVGAVERLLDFLTSSA